MSKIWSKERIKNVNFGINSARYNIKPKTRHLKELEKKHPELFNFEAISIGDNDGQLFFVPLDESSKENAEYILRAIKAYKGE